MLRDEAISILNDYDINFERHTAEEVAEAHEMAIKALQQQASTELIIKSTIKEYLDKFYLDTNELLIDLNHDLCKRIRCKEVEK